MALKFSVPRGGEHNKKKNKDRASLGKGRFHKRRRNVRRRCLLFVLLPALALLGKSQNIYEECEKWSPHKFNAKPTGRNR